MDIEDGISDIEHSLLNQLVNKYVEYHDETVLLRSCGKASCRTTDIFF